MNDSTGRSRALDLEDLIEEVRRRPVLYDDSLRRKSPDKAVVDAWRDISRQLGADVPTCKLKWHKLRIAFLREKRRLGNKSKSKSSQITTPNHEPYFDLMEFLVLSADGTREKDDRTLVESTDSSTERIDSEMMDSGITKSERIASVASGQLEAMEATPSELAASRVGPDDVDGDQHFLFSLLPLMKRLSPEENLEIRIEIQTAFKRKLFSNARNLQR